MNPAKEYQIQAVIAAIAVLVLIVFFALALFS